MENSLASSIPNEPNSPFDKKPSNRLVWIAPSICLHVVVFALWYFLPDPQPRKLEKRAVAVNSQQAKQLKQSVEDANLRELRGEVKRLQEIKRIMASIRAGQMDTLDTFEAAMRASIDTDPLPVLNDLKSSLKAFIQSIDHVIKASESTGIAFLHLGPVRDEQEFSDPVSQITTFMKLQERFSAKLDELDRNVRLVQAKMEAADSVLSWQTDPARVQQWEELVLLQNRVFAAQSICLDQQTHQDLNHRAALDGLKREWTAHKKRITALQERERKGLDIDLNNPLDLNIELTGFTAKAEQLAKQAAALKAEELALIDEMKTVRKHRPGKNKEKSALEEWTARIEEQIRLRNLKVKERQAAEVAARVMKNKCSRAALAIERLQRENRLMLERMNPHLTSLAGQTEQFSDQHKVLQLQEEALRSLEIFSKTVRQTTEGAL